MTKRISGEKSFAVPTRHLKTAGIDVDRDYLVTAIMDRGQMNGSSPTINTVEFEQTGSGIDSLVQALIEADVSYTIIESTGTYHIKGYEAMRAAGLNVGVINPLYVKALLRVEGKTDAADAVTLAKLAGDFSLRISNMPDRMQNHIRLVTRGYDMYSDSLRQTSNRLIALFTQAGITIYRKIGLRSVSGLAIAKALANGDDPAASVQANWRGRKARLPELLDCVAEIELFYLPFLRKHVEDVEMYSLRKDTLLEHALDLIKLYDLEEQVNCMCSHPVVNPFLAMRIIGEMGADFYDRYESASSFAYACGVAPKNIITGGKLKQKGTGQGNRNVKRGLVLYCKTYILQRGVTGPLKDFYNSYRGRGGTYSKAINAVARKTAEALWWMCKRGEYYRPYVKKGKNG
jgi:transposase